MRLRTLSFLFASLALTSAFAQGSSKEGYSLEWNNSLVVVADSLVNGKFKLPAWTITIFETDARAAADLWKNEMKALSVDVSSGKPMKATGARLPVAADGAIMSMAYAYKDRKSKQTKLTIAYALNDSTPMASPQGQDSYTRELAVKFNRAVVQTQIDAYKKKLEKATDKLDDAKGDVAKTKKSLVKSQKGLEKAQVQMSKVQSSNASAHGDIAGMEKKFALTNDPKDLQRLTKARERLAKGEHVLAKHMGDEAKYQGQIAKYNDRLNSQSGAQEGKATEQNATQHMINTLIRKYDSIK